MQVQTDVVFLGMDASPALEQVARDLADRLSRVFDRVQRCHVAIALPHRHKRRGGRFQVRVTMAVPGHDIAVTHDHPDDAAHEDAYLALADAFAVARRRLHDHAQITRGHGRLKQPVV